MRTVRCWLMRGAGLLRRRQLDARLDEELGFHLEMQTRDNLSRGMSPAAARRAARLSLAPGGSCEAVREQFRAQRGVPMVETLVQDLRYALRMLRQSPGFTCVALLSLAFGIGINCAIFSVVDALLLKQLPVRDAGTLLFLNRRAPSGELPALFSYPAFQHLAEARSVATDMVAVTGDFRAVVHSAAESGDSRPAIAASGLSSAGGATAMPAGADAGADLPTSSDTAAAPASNATGELVSGNFWSALGAGTAAGRTFTAAEDTVPGAHPVAVLSYGYWQRAFGRDPRVVGRVLRINGAAVTVVGVAARGFAGVYADWQPDLFLPLTLRDVLKYRGDTYTDGPADPHAPVWNQINYHWLQLIVRRRPATDVRQVGALLNLLFERDKQSQAATRTDAQDRRETLGQTIVLQPAARGLAMTREQLGQPLLILMSVASVVLLIACVNVANLLLARADRRRKEMAVRLGIGAGRGRLVRQLLTESLVLSGLGGALGLLLASQGSRLLIGLMQNSSPPLALDVAPDGRKLAFAGVAALLTAVVFGLAPALQATRVDLAAALKDGAKALTGNARRRARRWLPPLGSLLVAAQVALSLLLLIGAGLFVRSLQNLTAVAPGFASDQLIQAYIDPHLLDYDAAHRSALYDRLRERVAAMPGVRSASLSLNPLFSNIQRTSNVSTPSSPAEQGADEDTESQTVTADYFATVGMQLLAGRGFAPQDRPDSPKVAVVNQAFARRFLGGAAVGQRFGLGGRRHSRDYEVIGLVKDAKYHSLAEGAHPLVWFAFSQNPEDVLRDLEVRAQAGAAIAVAGQLRRVIATTSPDLAVFGIATMTDRLSHSLARERAVARLTGFFGLLALLLAAVGLYGVMSYSVARRTSEIGLRMALGAPRAQVLGLVLRQTAQLIAIGVAAGLAAALAATRVAASQLFGVTAHDPATIATATVVMATVALAAGFLPARRAADTDPMVALRRD